MLNILPRIQIENMPKSRKVKKKVTKVKIKTVAKPKVKAKSKSGLKTTIKPKVVEKAQLKFQKHTSQKKLKNICVKNIKYFLE